MPVASKLSLFLSELKRRKVYRVAALYAAVGVAISLGIPDLFGVLLLPDWAARLVIILIAIGLPIALVLAWAYEVRPEDPSPAEPKDEEAVPPSKAPMPAGTGEAGMGGLRRRAGGPRLTPPSLHRSTRRSSGRRGSRERLAFPHCLQAYPTFRKNVRLLGVS